MAPRRFALAEPTAADKIGGYNNKKANFHNRKLAFFVPLTYPVLLATFLLLDVADKVGLVIRLVLL